MSHGSLICRDCHAEYQIGAVYQESQADVEGGLMCPNCGGASFGV